MYGWCDAISSSRATVRRRAAGPRRRSAVRARRRVGVAAVGAGRLVRAVRQAVTPHGMQGRAAATITFVGMGSTPLGSLLGGLLAQEWGLRTGLLVTAAGMVLSPVLMAASPLARLGRELPAPRACRS